MAHTSARLSPYILACLLGLTAACEDSNPSEMGPPSDPPVEPPGAPGDGADEFISHVAGQSRNGGNPEAPAEDDSGDGDGASGGDDPSRAIAEADILQLDGDRLFALSRYAGLNVIDVSQPQQLRVVGRYRINATPFEMYLRDGIAYVMSNAYGQYEVDEASGEWSWHEASRMEALDVRDPSHITMLASYDVPGSISDSRLVGNILYLVTYENGWCWNCDPRANTRVLSFNTEGGFQLVDDLRFVDEDASYSYGPRSISVNDQRMYVSGPNWDDRDATLQVVDISDPAGDIALGAEVTIHGSIQSRWQMDEYEGVLRVISQPGTWRSNDVPHVQTYRVDSAQSLVPLASLPMVLPRAEDLQSVRFDGTRAFAVTFEQTDPLFTFDLSDPAQPVQLGELEIPGFLYHMEPRGNLLYALGFDQSNAAGALHVSIFDVSDLTAPRMTSRVNFGGDWAHLAEDQDRIHKAFNLALDENLILVPFGGGSYDDLGCNYEYTSGIQLVDTAGETLTLRGVAPQLGQARRALLHRDHLFGVTDNAVQVFDISDRAAPQRVEQVEVARNVETVRVMGDKLLRFSRDWWSQRTLLDFTPLDAADSAEPLGELDLQTLVANEQSTCQRSAYWGGQVLVHEGYAYVPRYTYSYQDAAGAWSHRQQLVFYVVDLRDQTAPAVIGSFAVDPTRGNDEYLGGIVITDSALLVGRSTGYYDYRDDMVVSRPTYHYDIFDLAVPSAPAFTTRFEVPAELAGGGWGYGMAECGIDMYWGWWYGGTSALVSGDLVVSQHEVDVADGTGRVRYYLDRLDVSDPSHPVLLPAINIPGQVVHFNGAENRAVTLEYTLRETAASTWDQCYGLGYSVEFDEPQHRCRIYDRRANVLSIEGQRAERISMLDLDNEGRVATSVSVTDERLFYISQDRRAWNEGPSVQQLESLAFSATGQLQRLPAVDIGTSAWWASVMARGTRAFVTTNSGLTVVQTADKSTPKLATHDLQGWGCNSLEVHADRAYCAMGMWGVASFPLE